MILYLDSSAIVKKHVAESGSAEGHEAVEKAEAVGTASISRAEVVAALRKAVRMEVLEEWDFWLSQKTLAVSSRLLVFPFLSRPLCKIDS
jgi:predicted nucleic acid-binding protein